MPYPFDVTGKNNVMFFAIDGGCCCLSFMYGCGRVLNFHLGSGIPLRTIISWQPRGGEMSHRWWRRIYTGSPCINPSPVRHLHTQEISIILFKSIIDVDLYMQLKETPCASNSEGKPWSLECSYYWLHPVSAILGAK